MTSVGKSIQEFDQKNHQKIKERRNVVIRLEDIKLEGEYTEDPLMLALPPSALVLAPHPGYNGHMSVPVCSTVFDTLANLDFHALRFNYRGIKSSTGANADISATGIVDATICMDWLEEHNSEAGSYWVVGYGFGAWVAMQLIIRRPEIDGAILISPPCGEYDFNFLSPCKIKICVIHGDQDELYSKENVIAFCEKLYKQKGYSIDTYFIPDAGHTFKGKLDELKYAIETYAKKNGDFLISKKVKDSIKNRKKGESTIDPFAI